MRLLLDSATFLWLAAGASELSDRARQLLRDSGNELYLSAVSAWEIAVKFQAGRLELTANPDVLVPEARERHAVLALPFDEESALHLALLPQLHRDPFDRMLICQALVHGLAILTPDETIRRYPVRTLW
ncbi:MAG: type II toxin-antitoxin system VapC family toxin [Chloroflexi bacterium]|nr:type II toxin-antitoxin system VapC family toxin [Chloroflexota bacterium]